MHTRTTRRQFRLQRQTFSIWRPCWRPYWISRLAIIYANLCRQFQKLQTIGNILVYDTSCCKGGSGLPLERVARITHCHPTIKGIILEWGRSSMKNKYNVKKICPSDVHPLKPQNSLNIDLSLCCPPGSRCSKLH